MYVNPFGTLMMKNIYNTGAFQLAEENFRLEYSLF